MTNREIDLLLDKYEAGNCSQEEEQLFDQLLESQALEMGDLYSAFMNIEKSQVSSEKIELVLSVASGELDKDLVSQKETMGSEYDQYVAYAQSEKSDIDVALLLNVNNGEMDQEIENHGLGEIYESFVQAERNIKSDIDVELLVQSHTGGLDSLLDQQEMGVEGAYNEFLHNEKQLKSSIDVESLINERSSETTGEDRTDKEPAKIIPLRRFIRRYASIAAVFVAIVAAVFLLNPDFNGGEKYADGLSDSERIEAEKALEQTLAALGMAKTNLDKGRENMKALKNLKHTRIFK